MNEQKAWQFSISRLLLLTAVAAIGAMLAAWSLNVLFCATPLIVGLLCLAAIFPLADVYWLSVYGVHLAAVLSGAIFLKLYECNLFTTPLNLFYTLLAAFWLLTLGAYIMTRLVFPKSPRETPALFSVILCCVEFCWGCLASLSLYLTIATAKS